MIVGLFETIDTTRIAMVAQVKDLLSSYDLLDKLIAYVKDDDGNLSTFAWALTSMVKCDPSTLVVFW